MSIAWEANTLDRLADIYVAATPAERDVIVGFGSDRLRYSSSSSAPSLALLTICCWTFAGTVS